MTEEKQETDRKRIEAGEIADFQRIVAQGISENLHRWKGIEATEKLPASPKAKVVILGSGKTGLPLILNTQWRTSIFIVGESREQFLVALFSAIL